jgi:hypothetical protein
MVTLTKAFANPASPPTNIEQTLSYSATQARGADALAWT